MLKRRSDYSFSTAFTSIIVERFFDLSMVLISFALMTVFLQGIPSYVFQGAMALGMLALGILIFMVAGSFFPSLIMTVCKFFFSRLPGSVSSKLEHFVSELLEGATVLRDTRRLLAVVIYSLLVWASIYYSYQVMLGLFAIEGSLWIGVAVGVMTALAVAAPSAPGFIGVYQAGCIAALVLFGVSKEEGVAFSIVTHAFQFVLIVTLGFISLARNGLRFGDLKVREEE